MASDSSLHAPALHFEVVGGEIPLETNWRWRPLLSFNPVHGNVVGSDGWTVFCINPLDGSYRTVYQAPRENMHFISCIHPRTGDIVLGVHETLDIVFYSLNVDTGQLSEVSLDGLDLWGCVPRRLIVLANGDWCVFVENVDSEDVFEAGYFSSSGAYLGWGYPTVLTDSLSSGGAPANCTGVFDADGDCITAYFFEKKESEILAGSPDSSGCVDGVAAHARFKNMRLPVVNSRYLFVRADGAESWEWRLARLDLQTLEVQSLRMIGLDHNEVLAYCISEGDMFAIRSCASPASSAEAAKVHFLRASLGTGDSVPRLVAAIASVDLKAPVQPLTFRLADGAALQVDRRTLVARSEYFQRMLSSGLREDRSSEVDLTEDSDADEASLSVLLRFVLCDAWEGPHDDAELAFRVWGLADRYQLPKLLHLAEAHLHRLLSPSTVLSFLGRVAGSGGSLEEACWMLLDRKGSAILEEHEDDLDAIIAQNAKLAKRLILWRSGCSASAKRARLA
mmetsp:Transcript_29289/g.92416  ORF Transcript_29289/g.92416 Transcript_29289/m.92416 type:complete len:507 (+) Transcript_29289:77-1597(+)